MSYKNNRKASSQKKRNSCFYITENGKELHWLNRQNQCNEIFTPTHTIVNHHGLLVIFP